MAAAVPLSDAGNHTPATKEGVPHSSRLQREAIVCPLNMTQKLPAVGPAVLVRNPIATLLWLGTLSLYIVLGRCSFLAMNHKV